MALDIYNVLKQNNFNFDILDLDIISYHRFHMRRIYDEGGIIESGKLKFLKTLGVQNTTTFG